MAESMRERMNDMQMPDFSFSVTAWDAEACEPVWCIDEGTPARGSHQFEDPATGEIYEVEITILRLPPTESEEPKDGE